MLDAQVVVQRLLEQLRLVRAVGGVVLEVVEMGTAWTLAASAWELLARSAPGPVAWAMLRALNNDSS